MPVYFFTLECCRKRIVVTPTANFLDMLSPGAFTKMTSSLTSLGCRPAPPACDRRQSATSNTMPRSASPATILRRGAHSPCHWQATGDWHFRPASRTSLSRRLGDKASGRRI